MQIFLKISGSCNLVRDLVSHIGIIQFTKLQILLLNNMRQESISKK